METSDSHGAFLMVGEPLKGPGVEPFSGLPHWQERSRVTEVWDSQAATNTK